MCSCGLTVEISWGSPATLYESTVKSPEVGTPQPPSRVNPASPAKPAVAAAALLDERPTERPDRPTHRPTARPTPARPRRVEHPPDVPNMNGKRTAPRAAAPVREPTWNGSPTATSSPRHRSPPPTAG